MKPTTKLDPALKGWLDNVIIPVLLQEYLRQMPSENQKKSCSGFKAWSSVGVRNTRTQRGR
jgi:hypothetical protein